MLSKYYFVFMNGRTFRRSQYIEERIKMHCLGGQKRHGGGGRGGIGSWLASSFMVELFAIQTNDRVSICIMKC